MDSILIDEARTPLIISGRGEDSSSLYTQVDRFVRTLRKSVVVELEDKVSTDEQADGDYVVDEKHKTCTLTASGIKKAEAYFKVENLAAAENMTLAHHIDQAIKAYGVMQRDIDYVVKDGQVIIVDEFTGRLMIGRRYNEGLHQAIEAKEGVKIAAESKTLATITFQNYFRMYKKLSGMTGTAKTEATEFTEIYGLNIVTVPTNRPRQRIDYPDAIYKTVNGKYNAVIQQVLECHQKGQPVLVGTVSVEKSETLAKMLQKYTRELQRAERQEPRARGRDRGAGRQKGCHHHRHQHGRPWYRYHAGRQRRVHGQGPDAQGALLREPAESRKSPRMPTRLQWKCC